MGETVSCRLSPEVFLSPEAYQEYLDSTFGKGRRIHLIRRSLDARHGRVMYELKLLLDADPEPLTTPRFQNVSQAPPLHIVGAGPAGLFAALAAIEAGVKPVIWERGKDVRTRRRDLAQLTREHQVNPESNYCFGEGGAGTYSDGKLYTRSNKRGDVQEILSWLVFFGAPSDILIDARPHIGTNKLPGIIATIRQFILDAGGEIHFNTRCSDLEWEGSTVRSISTAQGDRHAVHALVLAGGHSARDLFELLHRKNILLEAKPFALGLRAEHRQSFINQVQYGKSAALAGLPPASYSLVQQVDERGVYSFCMCPGGIIAPCATAEGEIVTNGWSPSRRNNPWANSGIVVELTLEDIYLVTRSRSPLAGLQFQAEIERNAYAAVQQGQKAPAVRLADLVKGKTSQTLPECSYHPGVVSADFNSILPASLLGRLRGGFAAFGKKMPGYLQEDAIAVGVESRTSSPVRIPRDRITGQHPQLNNLYPCGEGAGYAGGIASAAIDGIHAARKAAAGIRVD